MTWYTPQEVARILKLSPKFVRERFYDRPDVLKLEPAGRLVKRKRAVRRTLRISQEALDRFIREHSSGFELQSRRRAI